MTKPSQKDGWWATSEKEITQIMLFLVMLGTILTIQINSGILLMGLALLIRHVYQFGYLTKKQIVTAVLLATTIGLIATIVPCFLVAQIKSKVIGLAIRG